MSEKITVGRVLYSLNVGNAARNREQELTPVTVTKIGRKYFTAKREGFSFETQYHLDDWREKSEYLENSRLYASAQEWEDEKESKEICQRLGKLFQYGGNQELCSLEDLRKVAKLLNIETK